VKLLLCLSMTWEAYSQDLCTVLNVDRIVAGFSCFRNERIFQILKYCVSTHRSHNKFICPVKLIVYQ
jgi:hypothetical protein